MQIERQFFKCSVCSNTVGLIMDGGGTLVCCGTDMEKLTANSTDASREKHVPVITRDGETLTVDVGQAAHPMVNEHYIEWVAVAQGNKTQRVSFNPDNAPKTEFCIGDGPFTVFAYCNLHGLWSAEK